MLRLNYQLRRIFDNTVPHILCRINTIPILPSLSTRFFNSLSGISSLKRKLQDANPFLPFSRTLNHHCHSPATTMHILSILPLLPLALASTTPKPRSPIYLGEVFWPPTMTFLAWQPTTLNLPLDWCHHAVDCSDQRLFSLGDLHDLQIHGYFDEQAYLTRGGKRYATCGVTPESLSLGACYEEKMAEGRKRYAGSGFRKWTCWPEEEA